MTNNETKKAPTHGVYQVQDFGETKSRWNRVGSAWTNRDGRGFNLVLDAVPLNGRIVLREIAEVAQTDAVA